MCEQGQVCSCHMLLFFFVVLSYFLVSMLPGLWGQSGAVFLICFPKGIIFSKPEERLRINLCEYHGCCRKGCVVFLSSLFSHCWVMGIISHPLGQRGGACALYRQQGQ